MTDAKIWFVTGASSGFGRAMTEYLLQTGNKVVATLRKPEVLSSLAAHYPSTQLLVVKMDVKIKADVTAAFAKAEEVFGRIDVVFNNAGVSFASEVESTSESDALDVFETNFWGAARVTQEAVRFFRQVNQPAGGRLLQVSSIVGIQGIAAGGYYSASKFALEGLTECLVDELNPAWNIKATIIEPGPFRTGMTEGGLRMLPVHPAYADPSLKSFQARKSFGLTETFDGDVTKAVAVIDKIAQVEDAPLRFPLHKGVVATLRDKAKSLTAVAEKYERWSEDLYH